MIDQPSANMLLRLIAERLSALSLLQPSEQSGDADRYTLRILANLTRIVARELDDPAAERSATIGEINAALGVLHPDSGVATSELAGVDHLVGQLDDALRGLVHGVAPGGERDVGLPEDRRRRLHGHLNANVLQRLAINRPGYAKPDGNTEATADNGS